ncbi:MAG: aminopeptidase P family protein [Betaproteobacteria bacterium]|nr:aminopeptidase P family protein [Betaproteobacteria bacterium]
MADASERINAPISSAELERRWAAVRAAMNERNVDVLLMQASNDFMGGYVKYFTDLPATNGYPVTVVFPRDDRMTVVGQGAFGLARSLPPEGDGLRRGVARFMGTPSYAAAHYTAGYDAELARTALERYAGATVGLLGTAAMSYALVETLKRGKLSSANFVDASDLVDAIKAVKSTEEIEGMRRTAAMQDAAMEAVFAAVRPGMRDIEAAAVAEQVGHIHGSEHGLFLCASGPVGTAPVFGNRHLQNRVMREGDQFTLLIENNGPGGFYTELGRTCVLGKASQEMKDEFAFVIQAQQFTTSLLTPGAACRDIWEAYNQYMREHGRPEEKRLHCHGQGYDMVERPLVRFDETMPIGPNMVLSAHPTYVTERTYSWACDDFLVGESGVTEKLHKFPQQIFELA